MELARRLLTEYTRPGGAVADLTGPGVVAAQAEEVGRTGEVLTRTFTDRADHEVGGVAWADLAVVTSPADTALSWQVRERRLRARVVFAATLTRPGGIVAVITGLGRGPGGAVVDPAPGVVRAATCAGLVYLQHVIALTAPICEAGLGATFPARSQESNPELAWGMEEVDMPLPASAAEAAATITSPAHLNVSVFRLPNRGRTATAGTSWEVGA
ncbi:hypothetical protein Q8791_17010 [Nocardiopsis sp. CT-R113]|uniref:Uncharacterized protein n=1 Tax=Nocardiopsis codii TaxID=3065942 RepID=A0ABU7K9L8_9ACTN|nr:hypothetical protein [Nocardiopsis sp. CT-R113]MEE2038920.1 hypothetical protein [Nocardiopsis sp. CT-R113]